MVKYQELAAIMATTGTSKKDLAKIISKSPSAVTSKLKGNTDFKLTEINSITRYFKELAKTNDELSKRYPDITSDGIFKAN